MKLFALATAAVLAIVTSVVGLPLLEPRDDTSHLHISISPSITNAACGVIIPSMTLKISYIPNGDDNALPSTCLTLLNWLGGGHGSSVVDMAFMCAATPPIKGWSAITGDGRLKVVFFTGLAGSIVVIAKGQNSVSATMQVTNTGKDVVLEVGVVLTGKMTSAGWVVSGLLCEGGGSVGSLSDFADDVEAAS